MRNWTSRKATHDEFGAMLNDIRRFGKTTPNDRKRLRDLAPTFGWSECSVDSNLVMDMNAEDEQWSNQEPKTLFRPGPRPSDTRADTSAILRRGPSPRLLEMLEVRGRN